MEPIITSTLRNVYCRMVVETSIMRGPRSPPSTEWGIFVATHFGMLRRVKLTGRHTQRSHLYSHGGISDAASGYQNCSKLQLIIIITSENVAGRCH